MYVHKFNACHDRSRIDLGYYDIISSNAALLEEDDHYSLVTTGIAVVDCEVGY